MLLDLKITRRVKDGEHPEPVDVPLRFVVNGISTTTKVTVNEGQMGSAGTAFPSTRGRERGWGRVELPADAFPANNVFYFVFDDPPPLRSVIVSDDQAQTLPLKAALSAAADPERKYVSTVLAVAQAAEIPWADTALVVWQAPIPKPGDALARQLQEHVAAGRDVIFLPPESPDATEMFGLHWEAWKSAPRGETGPGAMVAE